MYLAFKTGLYCTGIVFGAPQIFSGVPSACGLLEMHSVCLDAIIYVHAPSNQVVGWSLVNYLLYF